MWQLLFKVIEDWNTIELDLESFKSWWQLLFKVIEDWNCGPKLSGNSSSFMWQLLFKVIEDWNNNQDQTINLAAQARDNYYLR